MYVLKGMAMGNKAVLDDESIGELGIMEGCTR